MRAAARRRTMQRSTEAPMQGRHLSPGSDNAKTPDCAPRHCKRHFRPLSASPRDDSASARPQRPSRRVATTICFGEADPNAEPS